MLWYFRMNIIPGSKGLELATARENLEYRNFYKKDHKAKITYERSTFLLFKYIFLYKPRLDTQSRQKPILNIWSQTVFTPWRKLTLKVAGRTVDPEGRAADHHINQVLHT